MDELGTDMMLVCSSVATDAVDDHGRLAEQFHMLAERRAGGESKSPTRPSRGDGMSTHGVNPPTSCSVRITRHWESAWTAFTCCRALLSPKRSPRSQDLPGEKIFFLQLADAPLMAMDVLQWSRHHRLFPGQGEFDLARFVDHILTAGYAGPLSLEVFNDIFRQSDPVHTAVDALRSLLVLEESVARDRRRRQRNSASPAPAGAYAVRPRLRRTHRRRRFRRRTGRCVVQFRIHKDGFRRSSDIEVWQQGKLGSCSTPPATATGAEITSLGVDSDSPEQLAARASAFLAAASPPDDAGPAVTAPDGTTLRFCDPGRAGSPPVAEDDGAGTGLTRIDHVALTQPFDYFDEAALF
jgi:4-hydroxyphenylpyruvate dioxygenase